MKNKNNTVSGRSLARSMESSVKVIARKFARLNEAQRLRAMQIIANMDDLRSFESIVRNSFVCNTKL